MFRLRGISIAALLMLCCVHNGCAAYTDEEIRDEIRLGRSIAAIIAGKYGLYRDLTVERYVNLVGNVQAVHNGRPGIRYYFAILDTDSVNAFACPGGYIFITRGLLSSLHNEAELAAVLSHEMAHINYRHVYNIAVPKSSRSADSILNSLIGGRNVSFSVAFNHFVDKGLEVLFKEGLPHEDEYEADAAAVFFSYNSGYDPAAYARVLDRISRETEKTQVYSKTHPSMDERLKRVTRLRISSTSRKTLEERFSTYVSTRINR